MGRTFKWLAIGLTGLIAVAALILAFIDWNRLRGPIASQISSKLDRRFEIQGDLNVDLGWTPRIVANGIRLANARWGSRPEMLTVDRLQFDVSLPDLFRGRLVFPEIRIIKPRLLLEKNERGEANWAFKPSNGEPSDRTDVPAIGRLTVEDSRFDYRDPQSKTELEAGVSAAGAAKEQGVRLAGKGRFQGEPFKLDVKGGPLLQLWQSRAPYPVAFHMTAGKTQVDVEGTFADPVQQRDPKLSLRLQGDSLAKLTPFIGVPLAETPPYRFDGRVSRSGERWLIHQLKGNMGGSDIAGRVEYSAPQKRPFLKAEIKSRKLDFKDLAGFIGADPRKENETKRLFPDEPYQPKAMRSADADVSFASDNIVTPHLPIDEFRTHFKMDHGIVTLDPLNFRIDIGRIASVIRLDARRDTIAAKADVKIQKVRLQRLLKETRFAAESGGTFFGQFLLETTGNSVADMLGHGNGEMTLLMDQGRISNLLVELIGLDIAESLGFMLTRDKSTRIRCIIGNFKVNGGKMQTAPFVIDTDDTNIRIDGLVDLGRETADLRINANPKDISILSARVPLNVKGPLKSPDVALDKTRLAQKGAASAVLGALLTPVAAIIPWIDWGLGKDSACHALIDQAISDDAAARKKISEPLSGKAKTKGKARRR